MKNSGIYSLYWWEQDLVYIGLSQNISTRKSEHYSLLRKSKHTNYKVQSAHDKYGEPDFIVLEYCSIKELPNKEIWWCNEFNALGYSGLCLVEPGVVGFGTNSNASKYSKAQVLKVFSLLYRGKHTYKQIAEKLKVRPNLVIDISHSKTHLWLQELYPEKYSIMLSLDRRNLAEMVKPLRALIKSPTNKIIELYSLSEFCRQEFNDVNQKKHMGSVLTGTRKSHKGYTLLRLM